MTIFSTERLEIKELKKEDEAFFLELLSAPEIIDPIPQPKWPLEKMINMFNDHSKHVDHPMRKDRVVWGVYEIGNPDLIGLCAFLTNDENQREIGYRFRKKYWGKGYGTEVTKHMIDYCFKTFDLDLLTADVNIENTGSVKILEKFFLPVREFFNENDNCTDRRYVLKKENWLKFESIKELR